MEAKSKIPHKQQDSNKKVLHALHLFLLTGELITKCWQQKVLFMDHLPHLILFLKRLLNKSTMNSRIKQKEYKKQRNLKIF